MMAMLTLNSSAGPTNKVLLVTLSLQEERLSEAIVSTVLLLMPQVLGEEALPTELGSFPAGLTLPSRTGLCMN